MKSSSATFRAMTGRSRGSICGASITFSDTQLSTPRRRKAVVEEFCEKQKNLARMSHTFSLPQTLPGRTRVSCNGPRKVSRAPGRGSLCVRNVAMEERTAQQVSKQDKSVMQCRVFPSAVLPQVYRNIWSRVGCCKWGTHNAQSITGQEVHVSVSLTRFVFEAEQGRRGPAKAVQQLADGQWPGFIEFMNRKDPS
jgi:hypothetical protein